MGENGKRLCSRVESSSMYEGRALLNTLGGRFKGGSPTRAAAGSSRGASGSRGEASPSPSGAPAAAAATGAGGGGGGGAAAAAAAAAATSGGMPRPLSAGVRGSGVASTSRACSSGEDLPNLPSHHPSSCGDDRSGDSRVLVESNAANQHESATGHKRKSPPEMNHHPHPHQSSAPIAAAATTTTTTTTLGSDTGLSLQWGQRRRQRNGRVEATKVGTSSSSLNHHHHHHPQQQQHHHQPEPQQNSNGTHSSQLPQNQAPAAAAQQQAQNHRADRQQSASPTPAESNGGGGGGGEDDSSPPVEQQQQPHHPQQQQSVVADPSGGKASGGGDKVNMELFEWPKFLISLSRKEKEDDFLAIKGSKLPQRPKRRSKHVEKILHYCSPGMWLCELTRERYEVREKKSIKKKPRGLKAMGSVDSDSD